MSTFWIIFAVLYCMVGLIVGTIMFGVTQSGAKTEGWHYPVEWAMYLGVGQLWGPYLVWLIGGTILGD